MERPSRIIPVSQTCPDLIPGHQVRVNQVTFDRYAIRVEYRITPGIEDL